MTIDMVVIMTSLHLVYKHGYISTGWCQIHRTIQSFKYVYENLHKITPLKLVERRKIRKQKKMCVYIFCGN